jgi:hypothetical protein
MRRIRMVAISALTVVGLGSAACSTAPRGEFKAIARNATAVAQRTSASTSTTTAPSPAVPITTPGNPVTTTTFDLPTTTVVAKPLRHCAPGSLGKTVTQLGGHVLCTHTATGNFWEPAP